MHPAKRLFWICCFFLCGVVFWHRLEFLLVFAVLCMSAAYINREKGSGFFLWGLVLLSCFLFGSGYIRFRSELRSISTRIPYGEEQYFRGKVIGEPYSLGTYQRIPIKLFGEYEGKALAFISSGHVIGYGDVVDFVGAFEYPEKNRDVAVFFPEIRNIEHHRSVRGSLITLKHRLVAPFERYIGGDKAALLSGITFGIRDQFTPSFKAAMQKSGTTHLVALSGYNILIVISASSGIMLLFLGRHTAFWFTLTLVWLFVTMVGFEPSIVRAAIMGTLWLASREMGRLYSLGHTAMLAAAGMIIWDPFYIEDPGFQLSFGSLMGISYGTPVLTRITGRLGNKKGILQEHVLTTVSAQLGVFPLLLANFDAVTPISLLSNMLILPLMPVTMFLGFMIAALNMFFGFLSSAISKLAAFLLAYEVFVIKGSAHIDFSFHMQGRYVWTFAACYYAFMGFLVYNLKHE